MAQAAPSLTAEERLARLFGDERPRHFGMGWISGVLGIVRGLLALLAVLCLHFPHYLTLPEPRSAYPLAWVRWTIRALACCLWPWR